jgi:hypothetical protein
MNEYEHEPVRGLPEDLPAGEHIVWQGEPDWRGLARRAFHVRKVLFYFGLLIAWYLAAQSADGVASGVTATGVLWTFSTGALALGMLYLLAWIYARTTVYTLTNRRLVLRFGVALPMMINLPLEKLEAADLVQYGRGMGDIALTLTPGERISHWALWPHARPWHYSRVKPMLRAVPGAAVVADLLAREVCDAAGDPQTISVASRPARAGGTGVPRDARGLAEPALTT